MSACLCGIRPAAPPPKCLPNLKCAGRVPQGVGASHGPPKEELTWPPPPFSRLLHAGAGLGATDRLPASGAVLRVPLHRSEAETSSPRSRAARSFHRSPTHHGPAFSLGLTAELPTTKHQLGQPVLVPSRASSPVAQRLFLLSGK
ncbi:hypothetical protein E2320_007270 [Naja naja]|nr:hypothetical protein E2320_007270 [Naja naja]